MSRSPQRRHRGAAGVMKPLLRSNALPKIANAWCRFHVDGPRPWQDVNRRLKFHTKREGVGPNGPTPSRAKFFDYFLNFFLPRIDRPNRPIPIFDLKLHDRRLSDQSVDPFSRNRRSRAMAGSRIDSSAAQQIRSAPSPPLPNAEPGATATFSSRNSFRAKA